jgi:hypothetical protein
VPRGSRARTSADVTSRRRETLSPQCNALGTAKGAEWHGGGYRWWGVGPEIGRRHAMHVDIVLLHIMIALGIIALAARAADGGK